MTPVLTRWGGYNAFLGTWLFVYSILRNQEIDRKLNTIHLRQKDMEGRMRAIQDSLKALKNDSSRME